MNPPPSFLPPGSIVDIYLRYSSDNQSIESQERAVRAWCESHHIRIARVFRDEARSGGTTAGRDGFQSLYNAITAPRAIKPAAVLIWSWSRFAREMADAEFFKWGIRRAGVHVWSITDNVPEGEFAPVIESLQHLQDAKFLQRLKADTTRGLHDLAAQGFSSGGFPPIGYKRGQDVVIGKKKNGETRYAHKWEFDDETRDRVQRAFDMRLAGASYLEIHKATQLFANSRGYADFFRRVAYAGAIQCGSTITWDAHPAYITRAQWEQLQTLNQTRRSNCARGDRHPARKRGDSPYLLSGLVRCGYCGWSMVGSLSNYQPYYRCDWRHRQGHARVECRQPAIVAHALHGQVIQFLVEFILTRAELFAARGELIEMLNDTQARTAPRVAQLERDAKRTRAAIANLVAAFEKLGYVDEIAEKLHTRRVELAHIESELETLRAVSNGAIKEIGDDVIDLIAAEMQTILLSGEPSAVKPILTTVITGARVFQDEIEISYNPLAIIEPMIRNYSMPLTGSRLNPSLRVRTFPLLRPGHARRSVFATEYNMK